MFDLVAHLTRQAAFRPGTRVKGVLDHIAKEIEGGPGRSIPRNCRSVASRTMPQPLWMQWREKGFTDHDIMVFVFVGPEIEPTSPPAGHTEDQNP